MCALPCLPCLPRHTLIEASAVPCLSLPCASLSCEIAHGLLPSYSLAFIPPPSPSNPYPLHVLSPFVSFHILNCSVLVPLIYFLPRLLVPSSHSFPSSPQAFTPFLYFASVSPFFCFVAQYSPPLLYFLTSLPYFSFSLISFPCSSHLYPLLVLYRFLSLLVFYCLSSFHFLFFFPSLISPFDLFPSQSVKPLPSLCTFLFLSFLSFHCSVLSPIFFFFPSLISPSHSFPSQSVKPLPSLCNFLFLSFHFIAQSSSPILFFSLPPT